MERQFRWLGAADIDERDDTFRVRERHPEALARSIALSGIRSPLIVEPLEATAGERFRIVSGWGRWKARPAADPVPCWLLPSDLPAADVWGIFLRDNDRWSLLEVARVLERLERHAGMARERIAREMLPLVGVQPSLERYRQHASLLRLGPKAREFVDEAGLPLRRAAALERLAAPASDRLIDIARELGLGRNEFGEALELVEEISRRDEAAAAAVLEEARAAAGGGRRQGFLARLRERRFPQLADYRARLEALRAALPSSVSFRVDWDPSLERPGIRLSADLPDLESLDALRHDLQRHRTVLEGFFDIL